MKDTVLVTGATGFIGACLTHSLVSYGYHPHIFTRKESNKWRIKDILGFVDDHRVDLVDKNRVESAVREIRPTIVYHFAAYGAYPFQTKIGRITETNFLGTLNLVGACAKSGFDFFVNVGSSSEYGLKEHPMKEDDVLEPVDLYGVSKAAATLFCQCLGRSKQLPIFTIRPFAVYGYYEDRTRLIPTVIKACLEGRDPKLLSPHSVRDFIFVEDVIDVVVKLAKKVAGQGDIRSQVFNVGYGKQYDIESVVSKIIMLTGANVRPLWGSAPKREKIEPNCWVSDSSRVRRFLTWKPRFDLDRGLQKTITWFKDNFSMYQEK